MDIEDKIQKSRDIIKEAIDRFGMGNIALAWTGGKDSTLMLWLYKVVTEESSLRMPKCMFIDEGDVFDEIREFVKNIKSLWNIELYELENFDVLSKAKAIGDIINVSSLNEENRHELKHIGFNEDEFPFAPESYVGNHLMKTVVMNDFLKEHRIQALSTAIRWDEQVSREKESYFSPRDDMIHSHTRTHPILHFTERDIWTTIHKYKIPFCPLYMKGYRSLGAKYNTVKTSDLPAWEQDLENTPERAGRGQEKEILMDRLRALGYM